MLTPAKICQVCFTQNDIVQGISYPEELHNYINIIWPDESGFLRAYSQMEFSNKQDINPGSKCYEIWVFSFQTLCNSAFLHQLYKQKSRGKTIYNSKQPYKMNYLCGKKSEITNIMSENVWDIWLQSDFK